MHDGCYVALAPPSEFVLCGMLPLASVTLPEELNLTEYKINDSPISVRVIASKDNSKLNPVILWIHGGGFIMGSAKQDDGYCIRLAQRTGATIVAGNYRLAPEHLFPMLLRGILHQKYEWIEIAVASQHVA